MMREVLGRRFKRLLSEAPRAAPTDKMLMSGPMRRPHHLGPTWC